MPDFRDPDFGVIAEDYDLAFAEPVRPPVDINVEAWRDDPVRFVREVLGAELDAWQVEALTLIAKHPRFAARAGRGVGKSTLLSWVILWWMSTRFPCKVGCTAPKVEQLGETLWPELRMWQDKMPPELAAQFEWTKTKFALADKPQHSFAVTRTARAENPDAFRGLHSPNMLVIMDEASGIAEDIYKTAMGMMTTTGSKMILTANPSRRSGYFYEIFNKPELMERWARMHITCIGSRWVQKDYVDEISAKYGEDSNVYRVEVLGEFPTDDEDTIIPHSWVAGAVGRDVIRTTDEARPVWGLDVAAGGADRNALAKRWSNVVLEPVMTWRQPDVITTAEMVAQEYRDTPDDEKPALVVVDSIGVGAGVVPALKRLNVPVRGINVGEAAAVKQTYLHLGDEGWYLAREWFANLNCKIPKDEMLIDELTGRKAGETVNGKLRVEPKSEFKKRLKRSPDCADAFILTLLGNGNRLSRSKLEYKRRYL